MSDLAGSLEPFTDVPMALPPAAMAMRLGVALVLGGLIGLDREVRQHSAGLRTHMLTALAACVFTLITLELHARFGGPEGNADPIRIVEAVTAGVAFLAAGAIIQNRDRVKGLTTGAGMWMAGAIGVATGAGYLVLALVAALLALVVLSLLKLLEG